MALMTLKASLSSAYRNCLHALVRDHVQTVLALVVPDHIAQVRHARHDLRCHAARATEQPAPAQGHKPPVQRRCKEFIDEPECMAPLVESHVGRIIIGPTTAPTKGNETALLNCGSRVMA